ncbi:hypothetical protein SUGI_0787650 [Cryptomeria japonica]|nr:hypothetical protein SUGI_0787650 [Cryptomeria japonica]
MGHCQADSKKKSTGTGFDLYGGVFSGKIFGSKPNIDQGQSPTWQKYNAGSYNNTVTFNDERGPLYWVDKGKDMGYGKDTEGNKYRNGGGQNIGKDYNGLGIAKSFGSMTVDEMVTPKKENKHCTDSKLADSSNLESYSPQKGSPIKVGNNNVDSKLPDASNLGSTPVKGSPIYGSVMLGRKSSDGASSSSSSSGSVSGGSATKSGGNGGSSPTVGGALKPGANHHQQHHHQSSSHSGELSLGSVSSGGSSSGGSPTAESVRRGGRSLRLGNVLNPKTLGSPTGDSKDCANNNIIGGGMVTGSLGNAKKPGHSRGSSYSGSSSRSSGELSYGTTVNSRPVSGPQLATGNIINTGLVSNRGPVGSTNASVNSGGGAIPTGNILPNSNLGNIFTSGKILNNANANNNVFKGNAKGDGGHPHHVLGSGNVNYGHGSVVKGNGKSDSIVTGNIHFVGESMLMKRAMASTDPEDVKNSGNDQYKKGHFAEALSLYDRAICLSPGNASYRSNRAAALTALGRYAEAVQECLDAIRLDPSFGRAHHRLGSLYLKLGQVENAKRQFNLAGQQSDRADIQRVQNVEKYMTKLAEARKAGDWKTVLRDSDAAIVAGADSSPQVFASKAEALLKLHRLDEADAVLTSADKAASVASSTRFHGIIGDAYVLMVRTQVDMALGRFDNAVPAAEKAARLDSCNHEVSSLLRRAKAVANARLSGNELFKIGKYLEACAAYGEGLEHDPLNAVLLSNRAACRSKLGQWEMSVEDCNLALSIQPNYIKALLRRAASNTELERWEEALRDYEILRREIPGDKEVAQSLFYVQVALKKSRGEEIYNMKFGGEVEVVYNNDQYKEAISSPGLAVVLFKSRSNDQCKKILPFIDQLCGRYPSVNFLKVDIEENPTSAKSESISFVPTFKIYKNGVKVKEILCPSQQVLENSVKYYI